MHNNEKFYINNKKYTNFLESQDIENFRKYIKFILEYSKKEDVILDVGCGTGIAVKEISKTRNIKGVDISEESIKICKIKNLICKTYDGNKIPYENEEFNVVGSINVLEHVNDTMNFLNECFRVTKKDGYIIIICPNFLSITNNYHKNTKGTLRKLINIFKILTKVFSNKINIEKMNPTIRDDFQPDDDAVNQTNPVDILKWGKSNNLNLVYFSSQQKNRNGLQEILDKFFITKLFLGSVMVVFRK